MNAPRVLILIGVALLAALPSPGTAGDSERRLAYVVSDVRIPFWDIMRRGIAARAAVLGYRLEVHSAANSTREELQATARVIREGVDGIILSPTHSAAAVTVLKLAEGAGIPVVIADIGSDAGNYVSYIASDNEEGAYRIGQVLGAALHARGWAAGSVGIIAIPQKRANGRARTAGFMRALEEAGIRGAGIRQQVDFSHAETYRFAREFLASHDDLRALWLQGSDRFQAALDAIADAGREGQVLLVCFDAEPEFLDLIPAGTLVGAAMQQPFLMGEEAVDALHRYLQGAPVPKNQRVPVLAVSAANIAELRSVIRRNVLGLSVESHGGGMGP